MLGPLEPLARTVDRSTLGKLTNKLPNSSQFLL